MVEDASLREEMMKLRKDPAANAVMGGVITQQNAAVLGKRIGRLVGKICYKLLKYIM